MDSMRSLNTSLPRAPKRATTQQPPEQLLSAFKTAALSVTNLYKTAASNETRARQVGYQEALDDILAFLDKEKLGLGDGEGWKVRRWATERLDGGTAGAAVGSESDDDGRGETEKRARSSSPVIQRKTSQESLQPPMHPRSPVHARVTSTPPMTQPPTSAPTSFPTPTPTPEIFSFRSANPYPQDIDMASIDSSAATGTSPPEIQNVTTVSNSVPAAVRVEVLPRGPRTQHRPIIHPNRHNTRATTAIGRRSLGAGAGSKRRFDVNDYFDLGNLGDGRDSPGGGGGAKRGRFI
ncbi:MAG: hypothetical protein LQ346_003482 [Caloplaca aetnensis]|nr:MAG: hypothetical protein LQ346_003482 [Caloplaca aetnensis]